MPSLGGSRRRSSKQASSSSSGSKHKRNPPPPDLALKTRGSSSSATSDAQVTPRSIFSSGLRASKRGIALERRDATKPVTREEALRSHPVTPVEKNRASTVDVFAFMQQDNVSWESPPSTSSTTHQTNFNARPSTSSDPSSDEISPPILGAQPMSDSAIEPPHPSPRYSDLEVKSAPHQHNRPWERRSTFNSDGGLHSDSGVSMHSGSPDEDDSPVVHHKYAMIQEGDDVTATASPVAIRVGTGGISIFEDALEADEPPSAIARDSPELLPVHNLRHRHVPSIETSEGLVPEACNITSSSPGPPLLGSRILDVGTDRRRSYVQPQLEFGGVGGVGGDGGMDGMGGVGGINSHANHPLPHFDEFPSYHVPEDHGGRSRKKTGYALLASKISAHRPTPASSASNISKDAEAADEQVETDDPPFLAPIYRKFETLTHRMLLYLQDEICELESQLAELDDAIAHELDSQAYDDGQNGRGSPNPAHLHPLHPHSPHMGGLGSSSGAHFAHPTHPHASHATHANPPPEARRTEAKLPSRLQWHRADLLGRVGGRLEVYQRAMSGYAKMTRDFRPVKNGHEDGELERYREWMERKAPIASAETGFLSTTHEGDLITVSAPVVPAAAVGSGREKEEARTRGENEEEESVLGGRAQQGQRAQQGREDQRSPVTMLSLALLATVVVFKVVPNILARLVVGCLVALAVWGLVGGQGVEGMYSPAHPPAGWRKREMVVGAGVMVALSVLVR